MNRLEAVVALRAIAGTAEKLADDLAGNRLWEGEYSQAVAMIAKYVRSLPSERDRR